MLSAAVVEREKNNNDLVGEQTKSYGSSEAAAAETVATGVTAVTAAAFTHLSRRASRPLLRQRFPAPPDRGDVKHDPAALREGSGYAAPRRWVFSLKPPVERCLYIARIFVRLIPVALCGHFFVQKLEWGFDADG